MFTYEDVATWKHYYEYVYRMDILDQTYIFRAVGREEYKKIVLMDLDLGRFQEAICEATVLYPEGIDFSKGLGGIAEVLSDSILDMSGLLVNQAKDILDDYRAEMYDFDHQVDVLIHEAFPEFTLEQIAAWPLRKTMFYLSRAEWILPNLKGIPLDLGLDEDETQEGQEAQHYPQQEVYPEFQEQFDKQTQKTPVKQQQAGIPQTEEEVLEMLRAAGGKISKPETSMDERKPELGWFQYMDELKGEFD